VTILPFRELQGQGARGKGQSEEILEAVQLRQETSKASYVA